MDPSTLKSIFSGRFTGSLNSFESTLVMPKTKILLSLFLLIIEILNSITLWSLWPRWPPVTTLFMRSSLLISITSRRAPFIAGSISSYIIRLSRFGTVLDLFVPTVSCSQLTSGKLMFLWGWGQLFWRYLLVLQRRILWDLPVVDSFDDICITFLSFNPYSETVSLPSLTSGNIPALLPLLPCLPSWRTCDHPPWHSSQGFILLGFTYSSDGLHAVCVGVETFWVWFVVAGTLWTSLRISLALSSLSFGIPSQCLSLSNMVMSFSFFQSSFKLYQFFIFLCDSFATVCFP